MQPHQRLSVTVQRTIYVKPSQIFGAFSDETELSTWFTAKHEHDFNIDGNYKNSDGDQGIYLDIKPNKLIRFTWDNKDHCPGTEVCIRIRALGPRTSQVRITHMKLESPAHVEDMKLGWSWALDCLKAYLESGHTISFEAWNLSRHR